MRHKAICKRGHLRTPENVNKNNACKECEAIASKLRYKNPSKPRPKTLGSLEVYRFWYFKNADKIRKRCREYNRRKRLENPKYGRSSLEKRREFSRKWVRENPEKIKARDHKRRTLKSNAGGFFSVLEWKNLCEKYEPKCLCCQRHRKLVADHVVPVSKGGTSWISNIQPLCRECNAKKFVDTTDFRLRRSKNNEELRRVDAGIDRHTSKA